MSRSADELETRVAAALRAEADGVLPEDGSLNVIRRRGHAGRQRRRLAAAGVGAAAVLALAVAVPLMRDDPDRVSTGNDPSPTPRPTTTAPGDITSPTPTTDPPEDEVAPETGVDQALWPNPRGATRFTDPVAAARSFAQDYMGLADAPLSDFRASEPGVGEVDVFRRGENGRVLDAVASTLTLRTLEDDDWFVTLAQSEDVIIESPGPMDEVSSFLEVTGRGRGYEGTIVVDVRGRFGSDEVDSSEGIAIAGAAEALEPFSVTVEFNRGGATLGVLWAVTDAGVEGGISPFTLMPVRLGTASNDDGSGPNSRYEFPQAPLWPFRTQTEADQWLATADQGHSPWHADAAATAQFFTVNYLGFTEIDEITSEDVRADEAWIGVGYRRDDGRLATSAVVHLRRFGPSPDAPWEVVGTRDTVLTLDTPRYGSGLTEALRVGGTITGVDENIHVQVRQSSGLVGDSCCVPAGGDGARWETPPVNVTSRVTDPALTVVAWSGGHVQDVEIFAITAVRPG